MKLCMRCNTFRPIEELNVEATIHHKCILECKDRKSCERRKRKKK